jgi:hypothetical protein
MSELKDLLEKVEVRRALIVDDAYDQVPLPSDLSVEADEWTQFFDDLKNEDVATIRTIYPRYDDARADELRTSEEFVATLWKHRNNFREDLISPLFSRYESGTAADLEYLAELETRLAALGLVCIKAGRSFQEKAGEAHLIVIDLFLGSTQRESDSTLAVEGLRTVIADRQSRPPLVILMSRNPRIDDKREEFRDRVGLFESAFRIIRKAELSDSGKLHRLLNRLASHYADSIKLASFLSAWNHGLNKACERTSRLIRRLDLADYAQIRQLLLSAEGAPTGSYLVDVFDRVLQHEIESETPIISAAIALNSLTSETYPPPYVGGSPNLQTLVHRSLFQHRERLQLRGAEGSSVAFGDVLRRKPASSRIDASVSPATLPLVYNSLRTDVLAVLTPACDLQHQLAERILLLAGSLRPLQPSDWSYEEHPLRTPVVELPDGHWWIKWNLKHIETLSHAELAQILAPEGGFEIIARLREAHALELQQKLLSSLGRVGLIAPMPATFPMRVEVYLPDVSGSLVRLNIPALDHTAGVCYVGRAGQSDMRVVLSEDVVEDILTAIEKHDLSLVHTNAREAVTYLLRTGELLQALEQGVSLPSPQSTTFKDIASPTGALKGAGPNASKRTIGLVGRNRDMQDVKLKSGEIAKAGIVLAAWDQQTYAGESKAEA